MTAATSTTAATLRSLRANNKKKKQEPDRGRGRVSGGCRQSAPLTLGPGRSLLSNLSKGAVGTEAVVATAGCPSVCRFVSHARHLADEG